MQIEIVDFYPVSATHKHLFGTLHVYIVIQGVEIDLRGVNVSYTKKGKECWFFMLPNKKTWSYEEKREVEYPIFHFTNVELDVKLRKLIREHGIKYIRENFLDKGLFKPMNPPKFERKTIHESKSKGDGDLPLKPAEKKWKDIPVKDKKKA